jgi:hypothetical protein
MSSQGLATVAAECSRGRDHYIRQVEALAKFIGRAPDTATALGVLKHLVWVSGYCFSPNTCDRPLADVRWPAT